MYLRKAEYADTEQIHAMQKEAFAALLETYRDYGTSPACESLERVREKFLQPQTTWYLILLDTGEIAGAIRVWDAKDGSRKRVSPVFILQQYRGRGLAQQTFREIERIHGADHWCLDTILQEKGNCHLYEKLGYVRTGRIEKINERMDIVYYEKNL